MTLKIFSNQNDYIILYLNLFCCAASIRLPLEAIKENRHLPGLEGYQLLDVCFSMRIILKWLTFLHEPQRLFRGIGVISVLAQMKASLDSLATVCPKATVSFTVLRLSSHHERQQA